MFEWLKLFTRPKFTRREKYPTWADIPPPDNDMNNVVPFPENRSLPDTKETPPMPEVKPPAPDYGVCHYTVGTSSTGYVELKLQDANGYGSTLKMNTVAVKQLIRMLEVAMDDDDEQQ